MEIKELLVEKYRPKTFEQFIKGYNNKFVEHIQNTILENPFNLPNIILHGSAGCGKTSLANIIINELDADHLYIDASFNNGIDIIRGIVNEFSRTKSNNPNAPKIVLLDEADRLSPAAQDALKNIIEARNKQCRFIFSCNVISRITEPLKSRCNVYNMVGSDINAIRERLQYIIDNEHLNVTTVERDILIEKCYPDIRSMIKNLNNIKFSESNQNRIIIKAFKEMLNGNNYKKVAKLVRDRSLNHKALLLEMFDEISEQDKLTYIENFAEADYRMSTGSTPEIQMVYFIDSVRKTMGD